MITLREAPHLALDEFRRIMSLHPFHFWQLVNDKAPIRGGCNPMLFEHGWQNADGVGRQEIIRAILQAEQKLKQVLGYAVAPEFETEEIPFPQHYDARLDHLSSTDAKARWMAQKLRFGYVQAVGSEELALIGNAAVTLSDADDDGLSDTFTASVTTSVTDENEIAAYFIAADRWDGSAVSDKWRIRPVSVSIASGVATIKGRAWTIVKPVKYNGVAPAAIDPAVAANLAESIAIYRRRPNPQDHGALVWETIPDGCACDTTLTTTDPAGNTTQPVRYQVRDTRRGHIAGEAASYDAGTTTWSAAGWAVGYSPTKLRANYYAGLPLESGEMPEWMKQIVARLAAAEIARPLCGCEEANGAVTYWQEDLSKSASGGDSYFLPGDILGNPFGTRRGHVDAWREIRTRDLMLYRAVAI